MLVIAPPTSLTLRDQFEGVVSLPFTLEGAASLPFTLEGVVSLPFTF
jgi:hypothetical protein